MDRATAISLAADRRGPPQDDQAVKAKPLAGAACGFSNQSLGANASPLLKELAA